jgi:hypothetical protein
LVLNPTTLNPSLFFVADGLASFLFQKDMPLWTTKLTAECALQKRGLWAVLLLFSFSILLPGTVSNFGCDLQLRSGERRHDRSPADRCFEVHTKHLHREARKVGAHKASSFFEISMLQANSFPPSAIIMVSTPRTIECRESPRLKTRGRDFVSLKSGVVQILRCGSLGCLGCDVRIARSCFSTPSSLLRCQLATKHLFLATTPDQAGVSMPLATAFPSMELSFTI